MRIKFVEVQISEASKKHLQEAVDSNYITMGPKTKLLEQKWSELFGYKHTVAVSSGTSACMAAVMSLYDFGAEPGDEVIVPALSFIATANAVRAAGLKPVFCDVRREDLLINEMKIEDLITSKTRAIMPVSLMGKPCRMDVINYIAKKHGIKVIVDNCEGHGCKFQGKHMSAWSDIAVYSCYAAHVLFSGEMGFVCTSDDQIADAAVSIRSHGRKPGSLYFDHLRYGLNLKPTDLHAAIGLGNVEDFDTIFKKRRYNMEYLWHTLKQMNSYMWFSEDDVHAYNSPHGFSMTVKPDAHFTVENLKWQLDKEDIEWKRNFGCMATQHKCFEYLGEPLGKYPEAEYVGNNGIHIGVHHMLSQEDLDRIARSVLSLR